MGIDRLQKLTGNCVSMNLTVSILTNVATEVSAPISLPVKITKEATSANVTKVLKVIFAMTLRSVTKPVLVM